MVVATAEALPEGAAFQSAAARSMSVSIVRGDVDLATLSRLQTRKHLLSLAVAGYVRFVGARYDEMSGGLARERDAIQEKKLRALLAGAHPRTPRNAATLIVGLRRFRDYSVDVGALNETQAAKLYEEARTGVVRAAQAHVLATSGGDPASRFVEILRSLFETKRVYVRGRKAGENPPDFEQVGWVASGYEQSGIPPSPGHAAEFIGWADEEHLYLEKNVAYGAVASFAAKSGMPFGIKSGALWEAMARSGKSLADRGRTDTTAKIQGQAKRVIQVPRPVIFDLG
jgi:hypothetical protein